MTNLGTHMYNWLFHYNIYTEQWEATERSHSFFSGRDNIITSSSLSTLVDIVNKTNGEKSKISKLLENG